MRQKIIFFTLIALTINLISNKAYSAINFNIKNGEIPKIKILIYGFKTDNPKIRSDVEEVIDRIKSNLQTTDLFEISRKFNDPNSVSTQNKTRTNNNIPHQISIEEIPNFELYHADKIGALLIGEARINESGSLELKIRLWDVMDERQLFGKFYSSGKDNYKKMANLISNEIYKAITGEKIGHFDSKISYIAESGSPTKRIKRLVIMDFDIENRRYLTNGSDIVLTPVFSKKTDEITFLRYYNKKPHIFNLDIKNNLVRKIGNFRDTTLSPAINPKDPNLILFSMIQDGNSDIYEMNLLTNRLRKLTNHPAIDTTPYYAPDGNSIVFSSDRDGKEQIYIMNNDGSGIRKISNDNASYSKPVWSPDGNTIAFTKIKNGEFEIGTISPNGRNEKTISRGYLVEGAKWSPNGRYLIYSKKISAFGRDSIPRLFIIDIITGFERELPTPVNEGATDPDWSLN